ncbi:ChbG/HpnK family deacetylase [Bacillus xiapuensis]|uniref:ChbG/HpnK family deacetylase n=1 Tax=Bacillus xiapuensis TaxID=2014075 RepID=A0ABU6N9L8_9BACI|nr:ChbG/HpnK family deacetylase [Bacillus xiapuensis]
MVKALSEKFGLPARRNGHIQVKNVKSLSHLSLFDFYAEEVRPDYFNKLAERIDDGQTVEIMCHPAYLDNALLRGSSYTFNRLSELEILTNISLPNNMMLYQNKDL